MPGTYPPTHVLFVDDEQLVLDGLRRQFRSMRSAWSMRFASSGQQALDLLQDQPADIVVTDMRMPSMSGARLCELIRQQWPQTVRYLLSGQTDQFDLLADIGSIHQFLQKPCSPDLLKAAILRASPATCPGVCNRDRAAIAGLTVLTPVEGHLAELCEAIRSPEPDLAEVGAIISNDVALSSKVLQLVNSAFFGIPTRNQTIEGAVMQMGVQQLRDLVLEMRFFDHQPDEITSLQRIRELSRVSHRVAADAYRMAISAGLSPDQAGLVKHAGMFSLIGQVAKISTPSESPEPISAVPCPAGSLAETDRQVHQPREHAHAEIGAFLLGIWGFAEQIVDSVRYQEAPASNGVTDKAHPLLWLHLARSLQPSSGLIESVEFDSQWAESIGFMHRDLAEIRSAA